MLYVRSPLNALPALSTGLYSFSKISPQISSVVGICSAVALLVLLTGRETVTDAKKEEGGFEQQSDSSTIETSTSISSSPGGASREESKETEGEVDDSLVYGECGLEVWKELGFGGKNA